MKPIICPMPKATVTATCSSPVHLPSFRHLEVPQTFGSSCSYSTHKTDMHMPLYNTGGKGQGVAPTQEE
ncbi:unnamed protein product [Choristocarpus tenellus]